VDAEQQITVRTATKSDLVAAHRQPWSVHVRIMIDGIANDRKDDNYFGSKYCGAFTRSSGVNGQNRSGVQVGQLTSAVLSSKDDDDGAPRKNPQVVKSKPQQLMPARLEASTKATVDNRNCFYVRWWIRRPRRTIQGRISEPQSFWNEDGAGSFCAARKDYPWISTPVPGHHYG
jgi:hypothetical protein